MHKPAPPQDGDGKLQDESVAKQGGEADGAAVGVSTDTPTGDRKRFKADHKVDGRSPGGRSRGSGSGGGGGPRPMTNAERRINLKVSDCWR